MKVNTRSISRRPKASNTCLTVSTRSATSADAGSRAAITARILAAHRRARNRRAPTHDDLQRERLEEAVANRTGRTTSLCERLSLSVPDHGEDQPRRLRAVPGGVARDELRQIAAGSQRAPAGAPAERHARPDE